MSDKKIKIERNKDKLGAFSDVIDLLDDPPPSTKKSKDKEKRQMEAFKLYNLLENEHLRIKKVDSFFSVKLKNQLQFSQVDKLIKEQEQRKSDVKSKLIEIIKRPSSHFHKSLSMIFNQSFD